MLEKRLELVVQLVFQLGSGAHRVTPWPLTSGGWRPGREMARRSALVLGAAKGCESRSVFGPAPFRQQLRSRRLRAHAARRRCRRRLPLSAASKNNLTQNSNVLPVVLGELGRPCGPVAPSKKGARRPFDSELFSALGLLTLSATW